MRGSRKEGNNGVGDAFAGSCDGGGGPGGNCFGTLTPPPLANVDAFVACEIMSGTEGGVGTFGGADAGALRRAASAACCAAAALCALTVSGLPVGVVGGK